MIKLNSNFGPFSLITPTYEEWISSLTNSQLNHIQSFKYKSISKWSPVLDNNFSTNLSKNTLENLCLFCETWTMYEDQLNIQTSLSDKLLEIINKIKSNNKDKKSKVIGKAFNYETGFLEYELENGTFLKIIGDNKVEPPTIDITSYLPKEFIKLVDQTEDRDQQINEILDDN